MERQEACKQCLLKLWSLPYKNNEYNLSGIHHIKQITIDEFSKETIIDAAAEIVTDALNNSL